MAEIKFIDRSELSNWWPSTSSLLAKALETGEGEMSLQQLYDHVAAGHSQLVICRSASGEVLCAMTCHFLTMPNLRVLHISALGGTGVTNYEYLWNLFKEITKEHGVDSIRAACKPAQARLFRKLGFRIIYQQIEVTLQAV